MAENGIKSGQETQTDSSHIDEDKDLPMVNKH